MRTVAVEVGVSIRLPAFLATVSSPFSLSYRPISVFGLARPRAIRAVSASIVMALRAVGPA